MTDAEFCFKVKYAESVCMDKLDGRILLLVSSNDKAEPRFQISDGGNTQLIFGVDIDEHSPGEEAVIDGKVIGYPLDSIIDIPRGEYWVQAVLHKYETFHRADRHIVKLPMDRGEGQKWNKAPGNLLSTPKKVLIDPRSSDSISITLDSEIPDFPPYEDTKYIKNIRLESKLLSEFWGRPWQIEAAVLLPHGFEENPDMKYLLVIFHGHFSRIFNTPSSFRETPPDPNVDYPATGLPYYEGYGNVQQEYAYKFYKDWTSDDYPRYILIMIRHPTPYFDDSYGVNSQITGPYGDAITYELLPYIEDKFRGIGESWSRVMTGGSTGGWISLATQVFYPDDYGGCWAWCPDPVDFRAFMTMNLYEDENAFYYPSEWKKTERPQARLTEGSVRFTMRENSRMEHVIGTMGRSGGEPNNWMTVFGPVGDDGYPRLLWDKMTGVIDKDVVEYMKENYDIRYILGRDWGKIGHKLKGKINVYCGDMDDLYYTKAVYLLEEFLEGTENPNYEGKVEWGDRFGHCYSGDPVTPYPISRLTVNQRLIPEMVETMLKHAPEGSDTRWKGNYPKKPLPPPSEFRANNIPG